MVSLKLFNCYHVDHHEFISHRLVHRSSRSRTHHRFVSAPQMNLNRNSSSVVNSYNSILYSIFRILDRHMKCGPAIKIDCRASNFQEIQTHPKMNLTIRHRNLAAISDTPTEHTVRIFDTKSIEEKEKLILTPKSNFNWTDFFPFLSKKKSSTFNANELSSGYSTWNRV